jgi:hypothetical protein
MVTLVVTFAAIDNANAVRFRDCGQSCGWGRRR